ncbi:hypothetical protein B0H11DRAFT_1940663 [Mycena galericulata]|nr:hypothetical protein B0H11DRAFT_1940663 [Mycena galericulata]
MGILLIPRMPAFNDINCSEHPAAVIRTAVLRQWNMEWDQKWVKRTKCNRFFVGFSGKMWIFRENIALLGMILRRERSVAFFFEFTQRLALLWPQVRVVYRENPSKGMVSKMTATSTELCSIPGGVIRQGTTSVVSTICQFSSSPFPLLQKDEFAQEGALGSSVVNNALLQVGGNLTPGGSLPKLGYWYPLYTISELPSRP